MAFLRGCFSGAVASLVLWGGAGAQAEFSGRLQTEYWTGVDFDEGRHVLSRFSVKPDAEWRFSRRWRAEVALRIEVADDDTGLGSKDTYSGAARPVLRSDDARLEIDEAVLAYRRRDLRITLGKQTTPWGVLDGVRVTDRFDAVRLRDFVLTETRPERISRWGVRARKKVAGFGVDASFAFDPTVNQFANIGDAFEPTAPRFRGGAPAEVGTPSVAVSDRDRYWADATYGARISKTFGPATASVLAFSGPDTDPVFSPTSAPDGAPGVALLFPRRELYGGTLDIAAGPTVLRLEAAHIPDQPVNTLTSEPLSFSSRPRTLAGLGVDWNAPADIFLNGQLAVDHIDEADEPLVRPETDVIATVRAQRRFAHDNWTVKAEYIGSLNDGDGAFRPSVEYRVNDTVRLAAGIDALFGDRDEQFGQYRNQSRAWLRISAGW